jgi:hypothetical protein
MGLDTLGRDFAQTGMMSGYLAGQTQGANLASTIASTRQKGLESDRYAQATPLELERMGIANETGRLGNLQPQADEREGVHGVKAKQAAMEAQATMDKLPHETKNKITAMVKEKNNQVLEIMEQTLTTTGSTQAAMDAVLELYPEMAQDKGWARAQQQYMSLSPQEVLQKVSLARHSLASSNDFANPKSQGEYHKEKLMQQGRMALGKQAGEYGLARDRIRAESSGSNNDKPSMAGLFTKYIDQYTQSPVGSPEREEARLILNMLKNKGTSTESSGIDPMFDVVKDSSALPPDKVSGAASAVNDPNLARLPPGSTALGNGVYQLPNGKKVKAN